MPMPAPVHVVDDRPSVSRSAETAESDPPLPPGAAWVTILASAWMPVTAALPAYIVMSPPATFAVRVLNREFSPTTVLPRAVNDCLIASREAGSVVMMTRCGAVGDDWSCAATAWSILWLTPCPKEPTGTSRTGRQPQD